MTKLLMTLTISVVASILVIGALIASPDAYSDKKHDDVLDECKCEKPHTLIVHFNAPTEPPVPDEVRFKVEIFKKLTDKDDPDKILLTIPDVMDDTDLTISAMMLFKEKLESNTAFVVYQVGGGTDPVTGEPVDVIVASMEIHTSCSQPLYQGLTKENNGYSLRVVDGLLGTPAISSIPIANASICEDEKKKSTGSITVKKALTNDNGGEAEFDDFTIKVTNTDGDETTVVIDSVLGIGVIDVPVGIYKLSETELEGYTTVLIAGDTGCPSMLNEEFVIKKGKNLSCTIYNDDDNDSLGKFVFQKNSLQIMIASPNILGSCDHLESGVQTLPCIQITGADGLTIVDPALDQNTHTVVLFSVFEDDVSPDGVTSLGCKLVSLLSHDHSFLKAVNPTTNLGVVLECPGLVSTKVINVNYVFINPGM